jgi:hypothetical protein
MRKTLRKLKAGSIRKTTRKQKGGNVGMGKLIKEAGNFKFKDKYTDKRLNDIFKNKYTDNKSRVCNDIKDINNAIDEYRSTNPHEEGFGNEAIENLDRIQETLKNYFLANFPEYLKCENAGEEGMYSIPEVGDTIHTVAQNPAYVPTALPARAEYSHLTRRGDDRVQRLNKSYDPTTPGYSHLTKPNTGLYATANPVEVKVNSPYVDIAPHPDPYEEIEFNIDDEGEGEDDDGELPLPPLPPRNAIKAPPYDTVNPEINKIKVGSLIVFDEKIKIDIGEDNCLVLDEKKDRPIRRYKQYWTAKNPGLLVKQIYKDYIVVTNPNSENLLKANTTTSNELTEFRIREECLNNKSFTIISPEDVENVVIGGKRKTRRRTKRRTKRSRTKQSKAKKSMRKKKPHTRKR